MTAVSEHAELRADARRNRRRILDAAAEAFAEGGLEVGVAEIARRAGVGAGTLFRRFPTKDDLIVAIVEERMSELVAAGREALTEPDAADALRAFMFRGAELHMRDRGFFDAVVRRVAGEERLRELRAEVVEISAEVLRRAQADGVARADVAPEDLPLLMCAAAGAAAPIDVAFPEIWRRYIGLMIDGLRPEGASALEGTAPTAQEFEAALGASAPSKRSARAG